LSTHLQVDTARAYHTAQAATIRDWLIVLLLMSAMIFSFVDRLSLSLVVEDIKRDLSIGDTQIGLLSGVAFGMFYATMGVPLGWLADRWSRKGTIILGITVWSLATAGTGFAASFSQLLTARIGIGAGEAGLVPASYSMIHDRFPASSLSRALSVFQVGSMLGAGLALLVGGATYRLFASGAFTLPWMHGYHAWQQTFVALSLPGIGFVIALAGVREPRSAGQPTQATSLRSVLKAQAADYALLFLGMCGGIITLFALLTWVPAILGREFSLPPGEVGSRYGIVLLLVAPLGILLGGWITDTLTERGRDRAHLDMALFAAVAAIPLVMAVAYVASADSLLIVLAALHFALSMPLGSSAALVQLMTPRAVRGRITALYMLVLNVMGLGLGPVLVGALSDRSLAGAHGLRLAVVSVAVPSLATGALLLYFLRRRMRT
jgi:MFS family permease